MGKKRAMAVLGQFVVITDITAVAKYTPDCSFGTSILETMIDGKTNIRNMIRMSMYTFRG
jgi:hypothetical protein